jgi:hypothetical protein
LDSDNNIRFVVIASMDSKNAGKILAVEYRKGIKLLLTTKEAELAIIQSVIRMSMRRTYQEKLGRPIYSLTVYEKVKRASINLYNQANNNLIDALMVVSFEKEADADAIVREKILPYLLSIGKASVPYEN